MSLDIKVRKKINPSNSKNMVVNPIKPEIVKSNKTTNQPPPPEKKSKQKKYKNFWWWFLFLILFFVFVIILFFIWQQSKEGILNTGQSKQATPGIVSTFTPPVVLDDSTPPNNQTSEDFDFDLLTGRVDDFDQVFTEVSYDLSATSTGFATGSAKVLEIEEINKRFVDLFKQAKELYIFLDKQVMQLKDKLEENNMIGDSIDDYLNSSDDFLSRISGELQVMEAFLELDENQNFANEIMISFKNMNDYFKQIRNMTKLINQQITENLNLDSDISTSTATSTLN